MTEPLDVIVGGRRPIVIAHLLLSGHSCSIPRHVPERRVDEPLLHPARRQVDVALGIEELESRATALSES